MAGWLGCPLCGLWKGSVEVWGSSCPPTPRPTAGLQARVPMLPAWTSRRAVLGQCSVLPVRLAALGCAAYICWALQQLSPCLV